MSVYVDSMRAKFGRMVMCHMVADTADELHAMARRIGLKPQWYQSPWSPKPASFPHYDVSLSRRAKAIEAGAEVLDWRGVAEHMKRLKPLIIANPEPWYPEDYNPAHPIEVKDE